jgi:hypothetical protein
VLSSRLAHARAFPDTAELVLGVDDEGSENVAASLAVLAGIAASDASCCAALGRRARGQDHRDAVVLLTGIAVVGAEMGKDLARLLDIRDNAEYGVLFVSAPIAARRLVRTPSPWMSMSRAGTAAPVLGTRTGALVVGVPTGQGIYAPPCRRSPELRAVPQQNAGSRDQTQAVHAEITDEPPFLLAIR